MGLRRIGGGLGGERIGQEAHWCPTWLWPWPEQVVLLVAGRRREPGRWDVLSGALHLLQPSL